MAENLELPEKPYFTVQEAAKRWKTDVASVLFWFREGLIIPSYMFGSLFCYRWVGGGDPSVEPDGNLEFDGTCIEPDVLFSNSQFYVWSYTRQMKIPDNNGRVCINLKDTCLTKEPRGPHTERFSPNSEKHDQLIPIESLVITRQELNHVEEFHFKGKLKPLKSNERDNLYMTIGVLARLIADIVPKKYGSPDNVKAQPMATALDQHMAKHKISTKGLSSKSLAKRIGEGLKLLGKL